MARVPKKISLTPDALVLLDSFAKQTGLKDSQIIDLLIKKELMTDSEASITLEHFKLLNAVEVE